ncbi:MAG: phosphoribosylformylglycinamidine synthase subunit PurL [Candidatus Omnitrophica bacterium]|nr:phosphoribosylformylglycinamidine synthase subunit PurL [Candidatus Omnitrophota bacterium]
MIWRIEIKEKAGSVDAFAEGVAKDILDLGIISVKDVKVVQVYNIEGDISEDDVHCISEQLLTDKITQEYFYSHQAYPGFDKKDVRIVEIAYNPGVMEPVEASTLKGISDLGIEGAHAVRTAKQYHFTGDIADQELKTIIDKALSNKLIQHVVKEGSDASKDIETLASAKENKEVHVLQIDLLNANDQKLKKISQEGQLFLNVDEMKSIKAHFKKLDRNPTDCELETIAQTWSEHCYHKTFRGDIEYQCKEEDGEIKKSIVRNLLKSTIVKATEKLDKPWCVSVFHDNAGVVKFDNDTNICFKVETHNHPSALEPFGGANTGIGGVIRDILGTGLGAKPVCNTDIFCFAQPDYPFYKLPAGALHPKRVMKGVVSGVRDYGNKMGIPTVNGAIVFDEHFVGNPLVYCGTVGLIPKGMEKKQVYPGDLVVVAGGKTGRDGIHGATFSSGELTSDSEVVSSGAVQIGDPIQEKKVLDVLLQARDQNLYSAITDCGAGGLSSAVGEMGQLTGARVDLDKVPLKYKGLSYMEIWISESQERMVMSVPPKNIKKLLEIFNIEDVEATVIGEFTDSERLELFYESKQVCCLDMAFLHDGVPKITKKARWAFPTIKNPQIKCPINLNDKLLDVMSHYNVCSKEWVIRQYDHEVQGGSVIKPLSGKGCDGPSDASVIRPKLESDKGIAVSNGINILYGKIDPFWMAASCIDEAIRQIVAVGGDLKQIALLDNFCWGNPDKADRLGGLVRCAQGCYKAATSYGTPFISGKDSLYNEYAEGKKSIAIPGTILISAMGIVNDVNKCVTMDLKKGGNLIYVIGQTHHELGGSIYFDTHGELGDGVPKVNFKKGLETFQAVSRVVKKGLAESAHDCSEGGIAAALAEMAFSGGLGVTASLKKVPYKGKDKRNDFILFSESNSRFIVEVSPKNQKKFEKAMNGISYGLLGKTEETPEFVVYGLDDNVCLNLYLDDIKTAWKEPLKW